MAGGVVNNDMNNNNSANTNNANDDNSDFSVKPAPSSSSLVSVTKVTFGGMVNVQITSNGISCSLPCKMTIKEGVLELKQKTTTGGSSSNFSFSSGGSNFNFTSVGKIGSIGKVNGSTFNNSIGGRQVTMDGSGVWVDGNPILQGKFEGPSLVMIDGEMWINGVKVGNSEVGSSSFHNITESPFVEDDQHKKWFDVSNLDVSVRYIDLSGQAHLNIDSGMISTESLKIKTSGQSKVEVKGDIVLVENFKCSSNGQSSVICSGFRCNTAKLVARGQSSLYGPEVLIHCKSRSSGQSTIHSTISNICREDKHDSGQSHIKTKKVDVFL